MATISNYVEGKCKQFKDLDPIALLYQAMCGIAHLHSLGIGRLKNIIFHGSDFWIEKFCSKGSLLCTTQLFLGSLFDIKGLT